MPRLAWKGPERPTWVVEAIVEDKKSKKDLFAELGRICPEPVVFASNTSSISITELGAASGRPERFIGMHFMNPVPIMKLVEIIRGLNTSDQTYELAGNVALSLGKTPLKVNDFPGVRGEQDPHPDDK